MRVDAFEDEYVIEREHVVKHEHAAIKSMVLNTNVLYRYMMYTCVFDMSRATNKSQ